MRILVISDTHIPTAANKLPKIIKKEAKISKCCIHAGDFTSYSILAELNKITQVYGVSGNMDDSTIQEMLPDQRIITLDKLVIAITHSCGSPKNIINQVKKKFSKHNQKIDIFIFGHSHVPLDEEINGQLFFNPGSATDTIYAPYPSYGILEINNGRIKRRIEKIG